MMRQKISIKWRIFFYLLVFTGILLVVLWLIQVCYLDTFYKKTKTRYAEKIISATIEALKKETEIADEKIDELAAENNVAIFVTDMKGNAVHDAEYIANSRLGAMSDEQFACYYRKAWENGGTAKIEFEGEIGEYAPAGLPLLKMDALWKKAPGKERMYVEESGAQERAGLSEEGAGRRTEKYDRFSGMDIGMFRQNWGQDQIESVIYVNLVRVAGKEYVVMVNTQLTPVDSTVSTLRAELVWITFIMVGLLLVIALLISRQVSKSLIQISQSAKEMAQGNFSVHFEGGDYREVAELSDTLNQTAAELLKSESLKRELIANISHDLRTPLTMIIAYSEGMRDLPGENTPENIQVVIDEAERLTSLVNDMLDISKLQAGAQEMHIVRYSLTKSIETVLSRYNKLKERDGYTILFSHDGDVEVEADAFKMCQVMYNLINNAVNYTGADKVVQVRQKTEGKRVRVEVSDSGEGVEPEALPYIWDRYYKVDKTHRRAVMGTGLGLSIVKGILELHGVSYGVESGAGEGTTFWFEMEAV